MKTTIDQISSLIFIFMKTVPMKTTVHHRRTEKVRWNVLGSLTRNFVGRIAAGQRISRHTLTSSLVSSRP